MFLLPLALQTDHQVSFEVQGKQLQALQRFYIYQQDAVPAVVPSPPLLEENPAHQHSTLQRGFIWNHRHYFCHVLLWWLFLLLCLLHCLHLSLYCPSVRLQPSEVLAVVPSFPAAEPSPAVVQPAVLAYSSQG